MLAVQRGVPTRRPVSSVAGGCTRQQLGQVEVPLALLSHGVARISKGIALTGRDQGCLRNLQPRGQGPLAGPDVQHATLELGLSSLQPLFAALSLPEDRNVRGVTDDGQATCPRTGPGPVLGCRLSDVETKVVTS